MRGVACSKRVQFLKPAFYMFLHNIDRYCETTKWNDIPHYYNERATLSLFSGACWQTGFIALEEYVSEKKNTKHGKGRTDFWVKSQSSEESTVIEVKQHFINAKEVSKLSDMIDISDYDARQNTEGGMLCGLTFFVPYLSTIYTRDKVIALANDILNGALDKGVDALAWWLPEEAMKFTGNRRDNNNESKWPILIAALRVAKIGDCDIADGCPERLQETSWGSNALPL